MLISSLLGWWYLSGWAWLSKEITRRLYIIKETFSVSILLKTLFSPWKQIQTTSSFQNFFQSAIDNLISRFIGASVRIFMLFGALIALALTAFIGGLFLILWPVVPLMLVILPILSITGVELF